MNTAQTHEGFDRARRELREAGRALWLAGLGVVGEVEKGGERLDRWFDRLVERGRPVDERQRKAFEEAGERTGVTVREMKKLFEDTVQYESKSVLKRLGLMTRDDVNVLAGRIDALAAKVDELVASHAIAAIETAEPTAPRSRPRQRKTERNS